MSSRICAWIVTSSAVVGSSARTSDGLQASAIAIIMRCRIPPLNWCGILRQAPRRIGDADHARASPPRGRGPAAVVMPRWISSPSVSCRPIVSTGFSDVIGSWKIMPISRPRMRRISSSASVRRSRPLKRIWPPTIRPAGGATSRMMLSALTRLAAAGLADQGDGLALGHVPGHAVDRAHDARACLKVGLKLANLQQRRHSARECSTRPGGPRGRPVR